MKQAKSIKHFYFDFAQYQVSDGISDEILLKVHYKENSYDITQIRGVKNEAFRAEVSQFAEDLLKRKHNTDFAKR